MEIQVPVHGSIIINKSMFFDPYSLPELDFKAKYIFITHSHYDHFSLKDIVSIMDEKTVFIATKDVCNALKKQFDNLVVEVEAGESYEVDDIKFSTFASYNLSKKYHPKSEGWVGYNVVVENKNVVVVGDSDITNELKEQKADVLFVPIGGEFTMDAVDAAKITNLLKPKIVVPVHFNFICGTKEDEKRFEKLVDSGIKVQKYIK